MRLSIILCAVQCLSAQSEPVPLSLGVHHLVDAALLDGPANGTYFAMGALSKEVEPIIVPEYPWERALQFYTSLVTMPTAGGGSSFLFYYACSDEVLFFNPIGVCVASSANGITWAKPLLNIHPYTANGTLPPTPSNIVFITAANTFGLHVFYDNNAGGRIILAYESSGSRYVHAATSTDGLVFTPSSDAPGEPIIPYAGFADTAVSIVRDEASDTFVAFGRLDKGVANSTNGCAGANDVFRWLQRSEKACISGSPCNVTDGANWSTPVVVLPPGAPDARDCVDNYNPSAISLADAGTRTLFLLLPATMRHMARADSGAPDDRAGANDGWMDVRLAVSRDGVSFAFPSRDAFLRRGIGARDAASGLYNASGSDIDAGFVFATNGGLLDPDRVARVPPTTPSNWVSVLYWGSQTTHAGGGAYLARYWPGARTGIFRARMRREGWVGLATLPHDPIGAGSAHTVPLLLPTPPQQSSTLFLRFNAAVDAAGELSVAILDAVTLAPLEGFSHSDCAPLRGNGVRQMLTCAGAGAGGDLAALARAGTPVVFDFLLTHATVFAWELATV